MNPDDIDLDEVLAGSKMQIDSTANSYGTYTNHLRVFLCMGKKEEIMKEHLTDELIAKFIFYLMTKMKHKPHHLKSSSAALGAELLRVRNLGIYDNRALYPYTIKMMKKWRVQLKIHPYHVEQSEGFSVAAVAEILALVRNTHLWLRDIAIVVVTNFTGLRMQDIERLCERNVVKMQPGPNDAPRCWELTMEVAKNNHSGAGMTEEESVVMHACPFAITCEYQIAKPTSTISKNAPALAPCDLAFGRAVSAQGGALRTLTASKAGINELRRMLERVNLRLPEALRTTKPVKGHSGRHGLCTNAVNSGASFDSLALVSKHKQPQQLRRYVKKDSKAMCATALSIGGAVLQKAKKRPATPLAAPAGKRQATPGGKSKMLRKGTPLRKYVHWDPEVKGDSDEDEEDTQDSPTTAAQLRAAFEGSTNCISHENMRRACVRSRGADSSSGVKDASLYTVAKHIEDEADEVEDEDEESGTNNFHIPPTHEWGREEEGVGHRHYI
ncbi:hypothetical protein B484DRAFT_400346 [Ochromonadaceae sp. CCMP2298]|nr:hypothetical protein B484DRAFT_400346 [Ochromonadaceae sp. CCMP2298]